MNNKPRLSLDEQIAYLKEKGVQFNITNETDARTYLERNNNYFKLTAYRKNYDKHPGGENKGKYINLEFAYLIDLAIIDMKLRYQMLQLALDVEHHTRLQLIGKMEQYGEDGYQIVEDYIDSLSDAQRGNLSNEIERSKKSIYCKNLVEKYDGEYPVWVFVEIVSFGDLINFYGFCADRFDGKEMRDMFFRLRTCKEIRNASAHNNCILNDLKAGTATHASNAAVVKELMKIKGLNANFRKNRMSNARIQQIVTLLYTHRSMVRSDGIIQSEAEALHKIIERMGKNAKYYKENNMISSTFNFLKIVVYNWYETN